MPRLYLLLLLLLFGCKQPAPNLESPSIETANTPPLLTESFSFEVAGNQLVGILDHPADREPQSTIIIVHGYGETNVVEQNWYYDLRTTFADMGINTLMWDKPGCGKSEGEFDINQPVESSAKEVVAAVRALQARGIKGSEQIGVWGTSRAGWIVPLAIQEEESIDFWISVSGVDDKENARYLIESNLRIEGRSEAEVIKVVSAWQNAFNASWQNGTYAEYLEAATIMSNDDFMQFMGWDNIASEEGFYAYQQRFEAGEFTVDEEFELMIYVPDFSNLLHSINKPVLAIFGEKDTNVDWRKTAKLYKETIGANPEASLTIETFPNADHNLKQSETGGIREIMNQASNAPYVEGYYQTIADWLVENQFGNAHPH